MSGPVLGLFNTPINRAVVAGAVFNLAFALPAALGFAALGHGRPGLPSASLATSAFLAIAPRVFRRAAFG